MEEQTSASEFGRMQRMWDSLRRGGVPKEWTEHHLMQALESAGWSELALITPPRYPKQPWVIRGRCPGQLGQEVAGGPRLPVSGPLVSKGGKGKPALRQSDTQSAHRNEEQQDRPRSRSPLSSPPVLDRISFLLSKWNWAWTSWGVWNHPTRGVINVRAPPDTFQASLHERSNEASASPSFLFMAPFG